MHCNKQCRFSPEMNTGRNSKQPASAGTLGEKERWLAQHTSFNTLDNWDHKTPTQSKKEKVQERKGQRIMARNTYTIHSVTH